MTNRIDTAAEREKCRYPSAYPPWARNTVLRLLDALDAKDAEIERLTTEIERLTKGSICEVAATNPSVMEYMRHWEGRAEKAEAERDQAIKALSKAAEARGRAEGKLAASELPGIIDGWKARAEKAEAALDKLLAEARLEGWRAGRDAATEPLTSLAAVLRETESPYHHSQASALMERADFIRALPEPKEASYEPS